MKKFILLLSFVLPTFLFSQNTEDSDSASVTPFEISNLTKAADESENEIILIKKKVEGKGSSSKIIIEFEKHVTQAGIMRNDTSTSVLNEYNQWSLSDLQNKWQRYSDQIEKFKKALNTYSLDYQEALSKLDSYEKRWSVTNLESDEFEVPEAIKERSIKTITSLNVTSNYLKDSLVNVLSRYDKVSTEFNYANEILLKIKSISDSKKLSIFSKNELPYFRALKERKDTATTHLANQFTNTWNTTISDTTSFIKENRKNSELLLILSILIFTFFLLITYSFNKAKIEVTEEIKLSAYLIKNPIPTASIFILFIALWVYPNPPSFITQLTLFLLLIPLIFLLPGLTEPKYRLIVYITTFLYLLNQTEEFMGAFPMTQRTILLIEAIVASISILYALRPKSTIYSKNYPYRKWVIRLSILYLIFSLVSIYSNLTGGVALSKMLIRTVIINIAVGLVLYFLYRIFKSLISFFFISNSGLSFNLIKKNGNEIKNKLLLYIRIAAVYLFIRSLLNLLGLYSFIIDAYNNFLLIGWDFGDVYLSIGQVLNFIIILLIFSIIASLLRALIEVEILPRFNLKKGIPMAAGLLTRYTVLLLGFLMAVAAAGISLDKLGFIVGALGVGIGFGLQSVVGNFVSGLILIFERPVRIGDIITANTIEGTVTEIGIRASKIRDWDGAEVIVPNMELISQHVTNWTLSDSHRRRELIIKTEFGSDPKKVIELINEVIEEHPDTLNDPKPMVLFQGFKEFSTDFRVLFFVSYDILRITSEVAVGIYEKLNEAGIKIPIPKRTLVYENIEQKENKKEKSKPKNPKTKSTSKNKPQED